jgi:hypothetical protein
VGGVVSLTVCVTLQQGGAEWHEKGVATLGQPPTTAGPSRQRRLTTYDVGHDRPAEKLLTSVRAWRQLSPLQALCWRHLVQSRVPRVSWNDSRISGCEFGSSLTW